MRTLLKLILTCVFLDWKLRKNNKQMKTGNRSEMLTVSNDTTTAKLEGQKV